MLAFSHHIDLAFHDANSFPAPSQFSYATANERGYVSASNSAYCSSTPLPQEVHQTTNDGFSGHSSDHADWPSAPSQALRSPYRPTEEAFLNTHFDSPDRSSAPSQTLHGSHHFTGGELPGANFDWPFTPLPVPQGPYHFAGGELSDPSLDWSSVPPLSHEGAYTAVDEGHFEPVLGSVEGATDNVYDEQLDVLHDGAHTAVDDGHFEPILGSVEGAVDTMYDELLGINPNDPINGFWGLDGFASTTDPTPEMTNSSGITTQRNGTAFTSPSLPAAQIAPNAANTHSSGDRISCTHMGCPATFRRAADFRRHFKKHSAPVLLQLILRIWAPICCVWTKGFAVNGGLMSLKVCS
ncbi:uncharacterized protein K441DRAFT_74900 [Cenococcum geophilum 1.58]|uniref:uncharacterized protein n=1 Tax=Cenococcum geophilum 1.58 TaxID=794803 RepID=UPI00358ED9D2|nr:hypothetical protein K441DRAFT_74900 [Cenococcum geophilum 1.58]